MYRRNCNYHPVNKGFIDEISYLRSHNRFKSKTKKLIKYYTDYHDVDEELRTGVRQGGEWNNGNTDGIARRDMFVDPTATEDIVASLKNNHTLSLLRKSV